MGWVVFSSNFLATTSPKWVNVFFSFQVQSHTSQMFSDNMYIKQVAASESALEAVLRVAISKGPNAKE